ncbi:hypothetical protein CPB86DRAFT_715471 [Serendipita vermifera]|nr:hypothetical protein CPB86DRAFT_715471 [Serendipita vermifera]
MASPRTGVLKIVNKRSTPSHLTRHASIIQRGALVKGYASHGEHYNEPSGLLFSEVPRKDGSKRKREDWELIWHFGMGGSILLATGIFWFRPDTSISTWALEEAKARLEARGDAARYIPSPESRAQQ